MEGSCSAGQSPQWVVVPVEEEDDDDDEGSMFLRNGGTNMEGSTVWFARRPQHANSPTGEIFCRSGVNKCRASVRPVHQILCGNA
jgi:hypothetical protein